MNRISKIIFAVCFLPALILPSTTRSQLPNESRQSKNQPQSKSTEKILGLTQTKPKSGIFVETKLGYMIPYKQKIPGTDVVIEMIPVPGGKFKMGSPSDAEDKYEDETPQVEITVPPFWMAKTETTWAQFGAYSDLDEVFKKFVAKKIRPVKDDNKSDAVTIASIPHTWDFTFGDGNEGNTPAATMTQFTARQYTKWLSLLTGEFYRLPVEAEWEYACRGGTSTTYHFGNEEDDLETYAWYEDNSDGERHPVGTRKPNAFGLHDMHGSVAEWVLDQYEEDWYAKLAKKKNLTAMQTYNKPTKLFPRVIRGGSWDMDADAARAAFRMSSNDEEWTEEDPNEPSSPWWYANDPGPGIGFRIMRPLVAPKTKKEKLEFWDSALDETMKLAVQRVIEEGRGAMGIVDPDLPKAIEELKKKRK